MTSRPRIARWTQCSILVSAVSLLSWMRHIWKGLVGTPPKKNKNLVYFLGDNPKWAKTWSAASHKLPTFRRNGGFYYSPATARVMLPTDKLAALGWPTNFQAARGMGTKKFPAMDRRRGDLVAGNAMHLGNSTILLLLGLVCFGHQDDALQFDDL